MPPARHPLTIGLLGVLLLAACDPVAPGRAALEAGDAGAARSHFSDALEQADEGDRGDLRYGLAVAQFQDGALDLADETAQGLLPEDGLARTSFLRGCIAMARAETALAQAQDVVSEPFAFDLAVRRAEKSVAFFTDAVVAGEGDPAAARNLERASLRLAEIRRLRDEAGGGARRTSGGPKIRLHPTSGETTAGGPDKPPATTSDESAAEGDAGDEGPDAVATGEELSRSDVLGLLERLGEKEREKRRLRAETRSRQRRPGERDW